MGAINPYREFVASISPTEFEELCLEILKGYAEAEHLSDFSIQHNVSIPADDGTYQIDVYARFIAMGVEFKVIAECKRYSSKEPWCPQRNYDLHLWLSKWSV